MAVTGTLFCWKDSMEFTRLFTSHLMTESTRLNNSVGPINKIRLQQRPVLTSYLCKILKTQEAAF